MAETPATKKNVVKSGAEEGVLHNSADELADTYSDASDKPHPSSIAQEQTVPEDWPGAARNG